MTLLTPAPQFDGQYGRRRNGKTYRAENHQGQLCWRTIPIWNLPAKLDLISREYLGEKIAALQTIKSWWQ